LTSPNNNPATIASSSWKLEGDYFEGCNCDSICPCIFKGDPNEGNCNLTSAWHIQNGNYDKNNVDGLNVVVLFHTPGNMLTGPKWKAALYILMKEQLKSKLIHLPRYLPVKREACLVYLLLTLLVRY
jgi:hypothetical protein